MVTLPRASKSRSEEGGFILLILIIFVLVIGIALVGFFIFKNSNLSIFGQQKASNTFVKADNPSQNSLIPTPPKTYQPAELMKERSRGSSYRQTNVNPAVAPTAFSQPSASKQTTSSQSQPSSVNPTSAPAQIPQSGDKSPTTFN